MEDPQQSTELPQEENPEEEVVALSKIQILWHQWLETLLQELLTPVQITVDTEVSVSSIAPKADVILTHDEKDGFREHQKKRLPDGIRQCKARKILLEFKITESANESAFTQTLVYDYLYKGKKKLKNFQLRSFLLSSKTVSKKTLIQFQYKATKWKGVYQTKLPGYHAITLLVLNELENTVYNAPVKCFCSRKKEREKAFRTLKREQESLNSTDLELLFWGIKRIWGLSEEEEMKLIDVFPPTPENLEDFHNSFGENYLRKLPTEKRLKGMTPKEILKMMNPKGFLEEMSLEERLTGISSEKRLEGISSEERLEGMSLEEIENFLAKKQRKMTRGKKVK
jgi:hypothetical protein